MRRILLTLLLLASVLLIAPAYAGSVPRDFESIVKSARAQVVVPPEWDGIWTTVDTVYTCEGVFQSTTPGADTICGGQEYMSTAPGSSIVFDCTGTADATTVDVTCTGSGPIFTGCDGNFTIVTNGTRTNDTFFLVSTINGTYSGVLCGPLTSSCMQVNTHGTRTSAAPTEFCVTPTKRSSWGEIKILYR